MSIDLFTDVEQQYTTKPDKPIWALGVEDPSNDKEVHHWLMGELEYLKEENRERFMRILRCQALYRGIQYTQQETREERFIQNSTQIQRITVNQCYDLVQQKVARLIKYRPGIAVLPANDEFQDKLAASNVDGWLQYVWYRQNFDGVTQPEYVQAVRTDGEAFLFVTWDKEGGDYVGEFDSSMQDQMYAEGEVTLMDDHNHAVLDSKGNPIVVKSPIFQGDVKYEIVRTTDVLLDRVVKWEDCNYLFRREVISVEEAKIRYPDGADNIIADNSALVYDHEKFQVRKARKNEIVLWHFYHKRAKGLERGRYIVFSNRGIVKSVPYPYKHRKLPCARLIDVKLPGELNGHSGINLIAPIHGAYNNATNAILKNQMLVAHPKWIVAAGSVKLESLGNDITIVQYKGPIAPQLAQMNPTAPEVFAFRDKLKEEMQQVYGIYGVSRGDPPPGIKAGVALQFLAEQESERQNEDVLRYNDWLKEVAELTIAVAAQYYPKDEKRMVRIMGSDKAWTTTAFDPKHLQKAYDIRIQNSSALPNSKAARIQTLIDLREAAPNSITEERFLDLIDLAQDKKFIDQATASVRSAEAENEAMLNPDSPLPIAEPTEYEEHLAHWNVHAIRIRSWDFKNRIPEEVQQIMIDHQRTHEYMMVERAKIDPQYFQQLAALKGFPMFFTLAPPPPPAPMPPPMPPGPMSDGLPSAQDALVAPPPPPISEPMPPVEDQLAQSAEPIPGPIDQSGSI
jgi:hypothetical protein